VNYSGKAKLMEHTKKTYRGIKNILKKQIENNINFKWAWKNSKENEEFVCVYVSIPSWSKELYTPQQLLNKLNESKN
tara:strand:+ start:156 stop:386 length:231 start_codon:yes stop_codon:yes gene_type:complete